MMALAHDVDALQAPRRVKVMRVSADLLFAMFRDMHGKTIVTITGLPDDAECIGMSLGFGLNVVYLYVTSSTFPEVREGERMSEIMPEFHTNYLTTEDEGVRTA